MGGWCEAAAGMIWGLYRLLPLAGRMGVAVQVVYSRGWCTRGVAAYAQPVSGDRCTRGVAIQVSGYRKP